MNVNVWMGLLELTKYNVPGDLKLEIWIYLKLNDTNQFLRKTSNKKSEGTIIISAIWLNDA